MAISILATASKDLSATCKLGQFLHYFTDSYLNVEKGEVVHTQAYTSTPARFPSFSYIYTHAHTHIVILTSLK